VRAGTIRPPAGPLAAGANAVLVSTSRGGGQHAKTVEALAKGFLEVLGLEGVELSVALVSDRAIRTLNRTWRGKDRPTDVLSFPAGAFPPGVPGPRPLGDIAISLDTTRKVARTLAVPFEDELATYLAHGLLHLLGHDHLRPQEARKMAAMERRLLGAHGLIRRAG
jgi:probable rRNA maturation factor